MNRIVIILLGLLLVSSCKKEALIIDGSDEMTFNQSIDAMEKTLPVEQKGKLREAIELMYEYDTKEGEEFMRRAQLRRMLGKKSLDEIFTLAETVATENKIVWARNSSLFADGVPKKKEENDGKDAQLLSIERLDFIMNESEDGITLQLVFYNGKGEEVALNEAQPVSIEVYSKEALIHTQKASVSGSNPSNIRILFSLLNPAKIKSNVLDIVVRVPHPERYLSNKRQINIPDSMVGGAGAAIVSDSMAVVIENTIAKTLATSVVKKFLENLNKQNFSGAYALARNPKWGSYQFFSSEKGFGGVSKLNIQSLKEANMIGDEVIVEANYYAEDAVNGNASIKQNFKLKKMDEKWFIISAETVEKKTE